MSSWRYLFLLTVPAVFAQTGISVLPGTAVAGGSGSASITITSPSSSADPSAVEWTLTYSTSALSGMKLAAGGALSSAGKSLSCASGTGQVRCIIWGDNTQSIPNGVLATASFAVSLYAPAASTLGLTGLTAVSGTAKPLAATASGATLAIRPAAKISKLACTATSIFSFGKTTCTVTLTAAAIEAVSVALGLGTNSAKVTIPSSVPVPAGASSASFTLSTGAVVVKSTAILVASLDGASASLTLSLLPSQ
jgi:trimeric autotransporter adhesin